MEDIRIFTYNTVVIGSGAAGCISTDRRTQSLLRRESTMEPAGTPEATNRPIIN